MTFLYNYFKEYRIVKVRCNEGMWQIQKRYFLYWKDIGLHFNTFKEAKTCGQQLKSYPDKFDQIKAAYIKHKEKQLALKKAMFQKIRNIPLIIQKKRS